MKPHQCSRVDFAAGRGRDHGTRDAIHDMIVTLTEMALRQVIHSLGAHKERPGKPQEIDYHLAQHDREVYEALAMASYDGIPYAECHGHWCLPVDCDGISGNKEGIG
jgi:hypothetical protein